MSSFAQYDLRSWLVDGLLNRVIEPIADQVFSAKKIMGTASLLGTAFLFSTTPATTAVASTAPTRFISVPPDVTHLATVGRQTGGDIDARKWAQLIEEERAFVPRLEPAYQEPTPFF